ncbi:hypothetical protein MKW98_025196 [Papaver atlanticum]|uniref:Uncharacterized protein n=1 Tax=Papaver atlanticum TaxID=357466 RepID=A0AAD4S1J0_9MAGN|nr:hypothetical protein MKW98_025196 [Papaver atlanticum]
MDDFESVKEEIDTGGGHSDEEGSVGGAATGLNGFQKLDKIKYPNRQSKQLEELTVREYDRELKDDEARNSPELNERKQSLIKELNSYVTLRKTYTTSLAAAGNKRVELFDGAGSSEPTAEENIQVASCKT